MRHFTQIGSTDVLPLLLQVERHPDLFNRHTGRTADDESPHHGVSDIWLRWLNPSVLDSPESFNQPFSAAALEWYPAMSLLPAARPLLMDIMHRIGGLALGGCIITKIPPGGRVRPHSDAVSWHAQTFSTKVYVVLKSNPLTSNWCGGEQFTPKVGDVFSFDNRIEHAVYNEGDDERVTLMAAIRCD